MVTLIFCGDLKYCPYLARYIERLEELKVSYRVLFWNRGNFKLDLPNNYVWYNSPSDEGASKIKKAVDFIGFRRWIIKQLSKKRTDKLILLSTLTAVLLFDKLKKYDYIFDIRDYSYENISVFKKIEKQIIKNSYFTAISSKGFMKFLPKYNYVIAHNFNRNEMIECPKFAKKQLPLKIVWNGTVRFFDFQKKYLDALKNDERFQLVYHGAGTDLEKYKDYCSKNEIYNVVFTGPYNNKEKYNLLKDADILNNCYGGKDGDQLRFAISNRYYDGLIYHIPQLVETSGYKASVTNKCHVGIALDAGESFADSLFNYYNSLSESDFDVACTKALKNIIKEDDIYIRKIDEFITK